MSAQSKSARGGPARAPRLKTAVVLVALVLGIVLVVLNWGALSTSIEVSLIVARFDAPLGLLVITLVGLAGLAFVAFFARLEAATLRNDRKILAAIESLEEIVEEGQASTIEQLRSVTEELRQQRPNARDRAPQPGRE